jgi:glycosyltransferase involved in cell wall biosynthesis
MVCKLTGDNSRPVILVVSVDALPFRGGISVMAHYLAEGFVQHGADVVFVGPAGSYVPTDMAQTYRFYEDIHSNVKAKQGEAALEEDARIRRLFARILARHHIDRVVLVHPSYFGVGVLDACAAASVPVTTFFHGFELASQLVNGYPDDHVRVLQDRQVMSLADRTFYLIGHADELLTNSAYTAGLLDGFSHAAPSRAVGCGIPMDLLTRESEIGPEYSQSGKSAQRIAANVPDRPTIAYVGRLIAAKRVDRVIQICAHQNEMQAIIIGAGPERERLERMALDLEVSDRIIFAGSVDEHRKWELLRASDFLCLLSEPSLETGQVEGFGISLVEGAAAACVPVSSGTGGMTDVVEDGVTGLILSNDTQSQSTNLYAEWQSVDRMREMVKRARNQIKSRYNWGTITGQILNEWNC